MRIQISLADDTRQRELIHLAQFANVTQNLGILQPL